jgi:hypothetical protein
VLVGSPLTPNALNDNKANFPEFHNVYIEPGSHEIYKNRAVAIVSARIQAEDSAMSLQLGLLI